jgi:hypothetical protein
MKIIDDLKALKLSKEIKFMLLLLAVIICLLSIFVTIGLKISGDNSACMRNPLIYGAKKLSENNDAEVLCRCSLLKPNTYTLMFTADKMWKDSYSQRTFKETPSLNFTPIEPPNKND